ncbi:GcrA family cell cycle regulator [Mesorhizobium sp. KR9-304]|uniref:GcrA family cell cycle regulator n=1 Tax=Mesorhizobium sp. KR9-304 TaxID=3156614 RepID=UPI0032B4A536
MSAYSDAEIDAVAEWLREGLSATQIVEKFAGSFRRWVSRNSIIGIVHRNKRLKAIGFGRNNGRGAKAAPAKPAMKSATGMHLHPGNIRAKKLSRAFDPGLPTLPAARGGERSEQGSGETTPKLLADLAWHECRWPVNDAAPGEMHLFCARAKGDGPYCSEHARRAGAGYSAAGVFVARRAA